MTESVTAPQPPRVQATCSFGHVTRSRNPPGTVIPCVRCNVEHGRTVMVTVPTGPRQPAYGPAAAAAADPGGARGHQPQEDHLDRAVLGCHALAPLSSPPRPGEPAGWITMIVGVPDAPAGREGELLARVCSAEVCRAGAACCRRAAQPAPGRGGRPAGRRPLDLGADAGTPRR